MVVYSEYCVWKPGVSLPIGSFRLSTDTTVASYSGAVFKKRLYFTTGTTASARKRTAPASAMKTTGSKPAPSATVL